MTGGRYCIDFEKKELTVDRQRMTNISLCVLYRQKNVTLQEETQFFLL